MKSLLFQDNTTVLIKPTECTALPCRQEVQIRVRKAGRIYTYTLNDKIVPEDPFLMLVRAAAFAIRSGEAFNGTTPSRDVKDFLIKNSVVI